MVDFAAVGAARVDFLSIGRCFGNRLVLAKVSDILGLGHKAVASLVARPRGEAAVAAAIKNTGGMV